MAGFSELYERHYEAVFRAALRVTGNPADAEDVLQTVFLRVMAQSGDVEDVAQPAAYFRRAAVNAAVDGCAGVSSRGVALRPTGAARRHPASGLLKERLGALGILTRGCKPVPAPSRRGAVD